MSDFLETTRATTPDEENGEIALALLALGGCPKCGKAFQRDKRTGTLYLSCCQVAYCPFCGKTNVSDCPHRAAFTRWGHWRIGGASLRRKRPATSPFGADRVTAYSAQEWEAAFGEEWEYFRVLIVASAWGSKGFSEKRFAETLLTKRLPDAVRFWHGHHTVFARDAGGFAGLVECDLKAVIKGMNRLTAQPPTTARFLRGVFPAVPEGAAFQVSKAFFTPQGGRFVVTDWSTRLFAWDTADLTLQEFRWAGQGHTTVRSSTEDVVEIHFASYPFRRGEDADESGLYRCDLNTGERRRIGGEGRHQARFPQTIRKARPFPQGTDCFIEPCGAQIRLFREGEPPLLTLTLAEAPQGVVLSPDGEHFFVRYPQRVALLRITAADIAALTASSEALFSP